MEEEKYLITTDAWFLAPDGKYYRAVWGNVRIIDDSFLGIKTNRNSTNWYVKIGSENNHVIVAGCQVHYAIRRDKKPNPDRVNDLNYTGNTWVEEERPCQIYFAE